MPELNKNGTFKQERDMSAHFAQNLGLLETGLTLYKNEHTTGLEFALPYSFPSPCAPGGSGESNLHGGERASVRPAKRSPYPPRVDILAVDAQGGYVVIECKVQNAMHIVVGQVASYVAVLRAHFLEAGARVRAFIVCHRASPLLWYALREIPDIEITVFEYDRPGKVRAATSPLSRQQLRFSF